MKYLVLFNLVMLYLPGGAQHDSLPSLKKILLEQLRTTHTEKDWFVPASLAIEGLTPAQANWKDKSGNHSIAELTTHLVFWNERSLKKFNKEIQGDFNGDNKETFSKVDNDSWPIMVKKLDDVLTAWERLVLETDEATLKDWYSTIAHIGTHNAYHTGQILYIRKMKGWWDDNKGVK